MDGIVHGATLDVLHGAASASVTAGHSLGGCAIAPI